MPSLQQKVLCIALVLVSSTIFLLHFSFPAPEHHHRQFSTSSSSSSSLSATRFPPRKSTGFDKKSNNEETSSSSSYQHQDLRISPLPLLKSDKFETPFRPSSIENQLNKYTNNKNRQQEEQQQQQNDNSVPVTEEDLQYAYANWIHPFESVSPSKMCRNNKNTICETLVFIWNHIENYVAKRTNSNAPIVTFIDPQSASSPRSDIVVLPQCYHSAHENVTIISASLSDSYNIKKEKRIFSFSPSSSSSSSWLFDRSSKTQHSFGNFWISCNFIAQSFVFDTSLLLSSKISTHNDEETDRRHNRLSAIFAALPMSLHVFALVRPSEVLDIEHSIDPKTGEVVHAPDDLDRTLWEGTVQKLRVQVEKLLRLCPSSSSESEDESTEKDSTGCLFVVAIHVLESKRACAKTWGAPLIQWGRKLVATRTSDGEISFQVQAVSASAKGSGRKVHPLQYIPSVNLDTLLGAGLPVESRIRLLGDMVRTPRYSDPLPHNWVVGRGGQAIRIDRVDERYDRDVDETKGYWGKSTRGYLHLLGHHLCLKIKNQVGLPAIMMASPECSEICDKECAVKCSYMNKGKIPCESCRKCGDCVEKQSEQQLHQELENYDALSSSSSSSCHIEYSSMHSARKKWKEWEKMDKKNGNIP